MSTDKLHLKIYSLKKTESLLIHRAQLEPFYLEILSTEEIVNMKTYVSVL